MNPQFLKQILPGLIPLLVFIIADSIFENTIYSLSIAIGFGLIQTIAIYIKEKRIDKFILLDTGLIIFLGLISILLDNEIFFKLKPAFIEAIFLIFIGISAFTPKNLLMDMMKRYMKNIQMTDSMESYFRKSMQFFFVIIAFHIVLVIYSAYFMSKEAWVFVSTVLFYILFGVYFVFEFIRNKFFKKNKPMNNNKTEYLPIINKEGKITGKATREACHAGNEGYIHPVVHVHIINNNKQLFLQKRPANKTVQPSKWDTSVGGHIAFGETIAEGLAREIAEELNIKNITPTLLTKYKWQTDIETEMVFMFIANYSKSITINSKELADGKFWGLAEIKKNLGKNLFTPNFEFEFPILEKFLKQKK